jgi:Icc-related predicted phosphoesterase
LDNDQNSSILFTSDLHGNEKLYGLINDYASFRAENSQPLSALILGGDLFPNSSDKNKALKIQQAFINGFFTSFLEKMSDLHIMVYVLLGNMDLSITINPVLDLQRRGLLKSLFSRSQCLPKGLTVVGCSFIPPSPFKLKDMEKREFPDDSVPIHPETCYISSDSGILEIPSKSLLSQGKSLYEELEYIYNNIDSPHILVTHCPPFDTKLDITDSGVHAGSRAVKKIIDQKQPLLSLHGHIHESFRVSGAETDASGPCLSVNPGAESGSLRACIFNEDAPAASLKIITIPLTPKPSTLNPQP